jgi:hypothetical protein
MSSPLDRDFGSDQLSPYAPKWAREAAHAQRRSMAKGIGDGDAQQMTATLAASDQPLATDGHRLPRSLEPTLMPDILGSPAGLSLAVLVRVAVAILIVVTVALLDSAEFQSHGRSPRTGIRKAPHHPNRSRGRMPGRRSNQKRPLRNSTWASKVHTPRGRQFRLEPRSSVRPEARTLSSMVLPTDRR